ncbi:MAG: hypothetical protein AAGK78_06380 [Planctomycetota bacterium]
MRKSDIFRHLNAQPFRPLRIFFSDGKIYDVESAGFAYIDDYELTIAVDFDESGLPRNSAYVSADHVTRIEPLTRGAPPAEPGDDREDQDAA